MDKNQLSRLDSLYDAISVVAEGAYVYLCDMKLNMSRWSKMAVDFFNLPSEYMYDAGKIWEQKIHPDDRESYNKSISNIFSGKDSGHDMQYRAMSADGNYTVCTCRGVVIRDENGNPEYFGGIIRNHGIFSYIDNITGLRSLYGYFDDIRGLFDKSVPTLIIMIGLSSFSDINDVYGYTFGNRTLQVLAKKIKEVFANKGAIYRMGGTRFAVITHTLNADEAKELYEKLQHEVRMNFFVDGEKIPLSMNGGAIVADRLDISADTFYSCLRYAYYESKHHKFGGFVIFDDVVSVDNRHILEQINVIRNCITEDCKGFYLCYQPIVDSKTEKLRGMEALVRWKNDEYGTVPPNTFIPVLEQDALFPELGKWILKQAMIDGKKFLEKNPDLVINVNLSYTQLERDNFVKEIFDIIEQIKFPTSNLCLELTERCRLLDTSMLKDMFSVFREKGIKIAVDDFGTGFSSLGFLRSIPVDVVKIDREFIKDIQKSITDKYSVKFISEIASAFDADVCAEGIENPEVRDCLKEYEIGSLQGYYYSKPITVDEMLDLL
ncbi:MAG: EAL domain-containing protein [Ruminococcus sp.]|nr:EAL domain-containing protein [Ruminococcus sp.]